MFDPKLSAWGEVSGRSSDQLLDDLQPANTAIERQMRFVTFD